MADKNSTNHKQVGPTVVEMVNAAGKSCVIGVIDKKRIGAIIAGAKSIGGGLWLAAGSAQVVAYDDHTQWLQEAVHSVESGRRVDLVLSSEWVDSNKTKAKARVIKINAKAVNVESYGSPYDDQSEAVLSIEIEGVVS